MLTGLLFFGGLWLTVQRLPTARWPGLLLFASFALRALLAIGGFVLVMAGQWSRLLAGLLGFLLARIVLVRRYGRIDATTVNEAKDS